MEKLKVMTVVGTRPELIRLSRLIPLLDEQTCHMLVHTGQNRDPSLKDVFFRDLRLREPDYYLECKTDSFAHLMADTMVKIYDLLSNERPDAVTILGDTNSGISAIIAERMGIPVYHMEAGNRSFDKNVPEELNRRLIDHISTFNLPYNSYSENNLISEGIHPRFICKTGSPMREVLEYYGDDIGSSDIRSRLRIEPQGYILASLHRQENVDSKARLQKVLDSLQLLHSHFGLKVLVSTHPRTSASLQRYVREPLRGIEFLEPFGFFDYCKLQMDSRLVVSDSGTVSEESSILGFPSITPRDSMERPEALQTGSMIMSGIDPESVLRAAIRATDAGSIQRATPEGYEVADFSERVYRFILSTSSLASSWTGLHDQ